MTRESSSPLSRASWKCFTTTSISFDTLGCLRPRNCPSLHITVSNCELCTTCALAPKCLFPICGWRESGEEGGHNQQSW